jgi:uncharacterized membrane protein
MLPSLLIGAASGLRAFTPLGVLALDSRADRPLRTGAALFAAGGELVGDKLPSTPARTKAGPAIARVVTGAIGGSIIAPRDKRLSGAIAGAVGAIASTQGGFRARAFGAGLAKSDWPAAVAEDLLAVGLSLAAVKLARR